MPKDKEKPVDTEAEKAALEKLRAAKKADMVVE